MGEPEGLLIEGAQVAAAGARDLWWRVRPPAEAPVLALGRVRHRLELFLEALHGESVPILPTDPEPEPTWLARLLGRAPPYLARTGALAATDGHHVWLPRTLDASDGEEAALDRYRLLAVEQAARMAHGFALAHPHDGARIEQDLYQVATANAVDRALAADLPGLAPGLHAARQAALAARPRLDRLTATEREVERLVRDVLAADLGAPELAGIATPEAARQWAVGCAERLRGTGRYRGGAPVPLWGEPRRPVSTAGACGGEPPDASAPVSGRAIALRRAPRARPTREGEDDASPGTWMVRFDDPMESVEDPMGLQRPVDHDDAADAAGLGDALSDLPEARIVRTPGTPREVLHSATIPLGPGASDPRAITGADGITYPEWDHRLAAYRFPGAIVRFGKPTVGDRDWGANVLARHAVLVRQVRRRFDGLRPRRVHLGRQLDGPELDLGAFVTAFADWRTGAPGDDRLYAASRPARRDLAIVVLADVSASTDAWVGGRLRIVDVEKEALVVLLEALAALGDRHAVLAFSGQGPRAVHVRTVKAFDDATGDDARRRIAALEPDGYTRLGTAIRHASALLGREGARFRLLLILSDGKPNDVDEYAGRYGIADTRQAVAEARLQGLMPFCLTVDREAPAYLPAIFGPRGFAILSRPARLPSVLVGVLRALVIM
jgi:nitric oxide reductase NorD protein